MEQNFTKRKRDFIPCVHHLFIKMMHRTKQVGFLLLFCLAFSLNALAQTTVSGTVRDAKGEPLPGVSVKLKGTATGASTDANGRYSISLPNASGTLVFTFIGSGTQEIAVNGRSEVNVTMQDDVTNLQEVVVTGYGTQSRETLTTSIAKLDTRTLENIPYTNALSALQGSMPGVRIQTINGQPGAAPRVVLRGGTAINSANSINANNPLYLVDGVIRENMQDIPADDIESLQVLKDAAATSIYGARASNGVVLVTTKSARAGVTRVSYSYDVSTADHGNRIMEYTDARDYIYHERQGNLWAIGKTAIATLNGRFTGPNGYGTGNDLTKSTAFTPQFLTPANQHKLNEGWEVLTDPVKTNAQGQYDPNGTNKEIIFKNTNFNDLNYRTAVSHNHYLSASGGTEKAKFNTSLGYLLGEGIGLESFYNRLTANFNGTIQLTKKLNVDGRVLFSNADFAGPGVGAGGINVETYNQFGVLANTFYRSPSLPASAKYQYEDGTMAPGQGPAAGNPHYYQTGPFAPVVKNVGGKVNVSLGARWDLLPGLVFEPLLSYYEENATGRSFQPAYLTGATAIDTRRITTQYNDNRSNYQADGVLSYTKSLENHHFEAKAGYSYYSRVRNILSAQGQGAGTDLIPTLNAAAVFNPASTGSESHLITEGVFGRVNYDYNQKYMIELTGRYDGASNLGATNRFAFFPGIGLGWNIHKENFWSVMPKQLSSLKLRGTYGENGNIQGLADYDWQGLFAVGNAYNNGAAVITSVLPNPDLRWEQSRTLDAGLDLGLFNNRVSLIFDYYERITDDLLATVILPGSSGYGSVKTNNGSLKNRGVEADLNVNVLPAKSAFQWSINFNASKVSSRIKQLPFNGNPGNRQNAFEVWNPESGAYEFVAGYQAGSGFGAPSSFIEGGRIGDMYAYKQIGIYATDAEAANAPFDEGATNDLTGGGKTKYGGDVNYADIDGDNRITSKDQVYVGNMFPTWTGGFSNYLTYKGFNLAVRTDFTTGHTIYNYAKVIADAQFQGDLMPTKDFIEKSWKKQGDITNTPRYVHQINGNVHRNSTYYEKGDFLALREVTLGYNLPVNLLRKVKISSMRVNLTGSNLHYFTKYSGAVPEEGGAENGHYPIPQTFTLGTNITF